ncbi:glucokinase [Melghirimyces profundicolus]|uniref:Glucokinase n=1 Tax=Melghirimyces profundicolus TaxID=1242148 RepID=A0A2T6C9B9_9BACL|nr:ROK family protein [Melghirimyces profundicolus]PTX64905.1 glucokinase [Melghirimyces profundicolus]
MAVAVGVDIGGTKVACGRVDDNGQCLDYAELPSMPHDEEKMFLQVTECIREVWPTTGASQKPPVGIGVGVPGKVDAARGVAVMQNNLPWVNFPLRKRLRERFSVDVILDNDVCMAAYGEWIERGGEREETFVYFTVSTGIACCTIHKGEYLRGAGFAGEIGLVPFSGGDRLERKAAGPAIGGGGLSPREVMEAYRNGDTRVLQRVEDVLEEWARGVYALVSILDPHHLVLGGGVMNRNPFLLNEIRGKMDPLLLPVQKSVLNRLSLSRLGAKAGCVGAGLRMLNWSSDSGKGVSIWNQSR